MFSPHLACRKEIQFQRQTVLRRLELTHHKRHVGIDILAHLQMLHQIATEHSTVRHPALGSLSISQQSLIPISQQFLLSAETHRTHVKAQMPLHPATRTVLFHATPVLKRFAHKRIRRNSIYRLIPIAHLHSSEVHLLHTSVHTMFRQRNPVTLAQHVVGRQLHTRHQPHNRVLEYQHQHRGSRAKPHKQVERRLSEENAEHKNHTHTHHKHLHHLVDALQRTVATIVTTLRDEIKRTCKTKQKPQEHDNQINLRQLRQHIKHQRCGEKRRWQQIVNHNGRNNMTHTVKHPVAQQHIIPRYVSLRHHLTHQRYHTLPAHHIGKPRQKQDSNNDNRFAQHTPIAKQSLKIHEQLLHISISIFHNQTQLIHKCTKIYKT